MSNFIIFHESVTDGPTDGRTDGPTDGQTDPVIEMRGRIQKVEKEYTRVSTHTR